MMIQDIHANEKIKIYNGHVAKIAALKMAANS